MELSNICMLSLPNYYETEYKLGVKQIFFVFPFLCVIDVKYINVFDVHLEMQKNIIVVR